MRLRDTAQCDSRLRLVAWPTRLNFVFYVVNSGKLFLMESDAVSTATPLLNGVMVQQQVPTGGFAKGSLNGNIVIYLTGHSQCGSLAGVPKAVAGLLTTNGSGALSLTYGNHGNVFLSGPKRCRKRKQRPHSIESSGRVHDRWSNARTGNYTPGANPPHEPQNPPGQGVLCSA